MSDEIIKVTISKTGKTKVEGVGFKGNACTLKTAGIERALSGGGANSREYKPEWNESGGETVKQEQGW